MTIGEDAIVAFSPEPDRGSIGSLHSILPPLEDDPPVHPGRTLASVSMAGQDVRHTMLIRLLAQLPDSSQVSPTQSYALIGLAVMGLIYLMVIRPMMRKKKDPLERPSGFASLSQQRSVEREMQNLLVELSEMARQITAQLDTRSTKLELLLKEADQKIAALQSGTSGAPIGVSTPQDRPPAAAQLADESSAATPAADLRHADVYALADQGHDVGAIASQLSRPRGEVELILALRGNR